MLVFLECEKDSQIIFWTESNREDLLSIMIGIKLENVNNVTDVKTDSYVVMTSRLHLYGGSFCFQAVLY